MKSMIKSGALALGLSFAAGTTQAGIIPVDGDWEYFDFGGVDSGASDQPFTFTALTAVNLYVTDGFLAGDRFDIFNFLTLLGSTSSPSGDDNCGGDFDLCYADDRWSSAAFNLAPGDYSITVNTTASPFGSGGAALRVATAEASPVPEPSILALFGLGMVGLGLARRRKQRV